jgi:predicted nucleotidyltransferase
MTTSHPAGGATPSSERLQEVVRRIVATAQPDRIILFGSAARGDMHAGSDIDVLVVKADIAHRGRLAEDIYMALSGVGVAVDVVVVTPQDIERFKDRVGTVIRPALREGREIYAA